MVTSDDRPYADQARLNHPTCSYWVYVLSEQQYISRRGALLDPTVWITRDLGTMQDSPSPPFPSLLVAFAPVYVQVSPAQSRVCEAMRRRGSTQAALPTTPSILYLGGRHLNFSPRRYMMWRGPSPSVPCHLTCYILCLNQSLGSCFIHLPLMTS